MFYDTGTQPEKALITNIPWVRDSEETILCPLLMASKTLFPVTFFSDVKFFFKFYSTKRRSKRIKLCKKNIGHQPRSGENSSSHSSQVGHLARARFRGESFPKVLTFLGSEHVHLKFLQSIDCSQQYNFDDEQFSSHLRMLSLR